MSSPIRSILRNSANKIITNRKVQFDSLEKSNIQNENEKEKENKDQIDNLNQNKKKKLQKTPPTEIKTYKNIKYDLNDSPKLDLNALIKTNPKIYMPNNDEIINFGSESYVWASQSETEKSLEESTPLQKTIIKSEEKNDEGKNVNTIEKQSDKLRLLSLDLSNESIETNQHSAPAKNNNNLGNSEINEKQITSNSLNNELIYVSTKSNVLSWSDYPISSNENKSNSNQINSIDSSACVENMKSFSLITPRYYQNDENTVIDLEIPSPVQCRSVIAKLKVGVDLNDFNEKKNDEPYDIVNNGLEEFFYAINQKSLSDTLQLTAMKLRKVIPDVNNEFNVWQVSLEKISDPDVLSNLSTNLAYLSAWEVSEKRCHRYSTKLHNTLRKFDIKAVLTKIDTFKNYQNLLFQETLKELLVFANSSARITWKLNFENQLANDIIKLTNLHVKNVIDNIKHVSDSINDKEKQFLEQKEKITSELKRKRSRIFLLKKYQEIVKCLSNIKRESCRRRELILNHIKECEYEHKKILDYIKLEQNAMQIHNKKYQRIKAIIKNLNSYLDFGEMLKEWNPIKVKMNPEQAFLIVEYNMRNFFSFTNPLVLLDHKLWLTNDYNKNNNDACLMRSKIIKIFSNKSTYLDNFILTLPSFSLMINVRQLQLSNYMSFGPLQICRKNVKDILKSLNYDNNEGQEDNSNKIFSNKKIDDEVNKTVIATKYIAENEVKSQEEILADAFTKLLIIFSAECYEELNLIITKKLVKSNILDDFINVVYFYITNLPNIILQILSLHQSYSPHRSFEDIRFDLKDLHELSTKIICYISCPKFYIKLPCIIEYRIQSLLFEFNIPNLLQSGKLHSSLTEISLGGKKIYSSQDLSTILREVSLSTIYTSNPPLTCLNSDHTMEKLINKITTLRNSLSSMTKV